MKKIFKLFISLIVIYTLASCKNDIRSKYLGDWRFTVEMTKFNIDSIGQFWQDTIFYNGKITNGNNDNELTIQYTEDCFVYLNIDEYEILSGFPNVYCNGKFINYSEIYLYLKWGGLGGNTTHIINGYKE